MLSVTVIVLLVLWVIGIVTGNLFGGLTHLLVVSAAVAFIIRMSRGADPLRRG